MDSIVRKFMEYPPFCWWKFGKNSARGQRMKIINECNKKFAQEMDIENFLSKVRDTHDMFKHMVS
jgi:hypothetical protein